MFGVISENSAWRGGLGLKETENKGQGTLMRLPENNLTKRAAGIYTVIYLGGTSLHIRAAAEAA